MKEISKVLEGHSQRISAVDKRRNVLIKEINDECDRDGENLDRRWALVKEAYRQALLEQIEEYSLTIKMINSLFT